MGLLRGRYVQRDRAEWWKSIELVSCLGLVGRQIVQHNVDVLRPAGLVHQLTQKGNELRTGVPFRGLACHLAGLHIQSGIERQGPVTVILEAMPFRSPRRKGQHGIEPVQGLNRRLLVDAEHGCMLRRMQVQTDDVRRFGFKVGIVTGQVVLQAVRLQAGLRENALYRRLAHSQLAGQFTASTSACFRRAASVAPAAPALRA